MVGGGRTVAFAEVGVGAVGLVESILPLHHHAKVLVVEDHDLGLEPLHGGGGQLLAVHQERAIPVNVHHELLLPAILPCTQPPHLTAAPTPHVLHGNGPAVPVLADGQACGQRRVHASASASVPSYAAAAPSAEGRPKPMDPRPPELTQLRGSLKGYHCAAHI